MFVRSTLLGPRNNFCIYRYHRTYRNKSKKLVFELCTANSNIKLDLLDAIEKKIILQKMTGTEHKLPFRIELN